MGEGEVTVDQSEDQPAGAAIVAPTVVVIPPADSGDSGDDTELARLRSENEDLKTRMAALESAQMAPAEVSAVAADTAESVAAAAVSDAEAVAEIPAEIADDVSEVIAPLDETVESVIPEITESLDDVTDGEIPATEAAAVGEATALVDGETLPSGAPLKRHWSKGAWVFGDPEFRDPFERKSDA